VSRVKTLARAERKVLPFEKKTAPARGATEAVLGAMPGAARHVLIVPLKGQPMPIIFRVIAGPILGYATGLKRPQNHGVGLSDRSRLN
jgi:hypothetical protein